MSNLSELFPAGAGKEVSFVASGTIATGDTVILNSDGTVSAVDGVAFSQGSEATFDSSNNFDDSASVYDTTGNRVVIAYRNGDNSYAVVGTVSGTSISFGTPVAWHSANSAALQIAMTYDSGQDRIVIAFKDESVGNYGTAIVGNVTSNSVSFGSKTVFYSAGVSYPEINYDSGQGKVVVYYPGTSGYGQARVGTVSGTSISFGSAVNFTSGTNVEAISAVYDSNAGKHLVAFRDSTNGDSKVATVSGTSISFGSATTFDSGATSTRARPVAFDSTNNKVVIFYRNSSGVLSARVGTISGTSVSYGDEVATSFTVSGSEIEPGTATYDSSAGRVSLVFYSNTLTKTYLLSGQVSGTSISFLSPAELNGGDPGRYPQMTYDPDTQQAAVSYSDTNNSPRPKAVMVKTPYTNVTSDNFLGISKGAISNAASGSITIKGGVSSDVSGLTPNTAYYVQNDGSLGTTSTGAVLAGRALSATSIDLDYST